jgi:hypothetical protein
VPSDPSPDPRAVMRSRRRRRLLPLLAALVVVGGVAAIALSSGGGSKKSRPASGTGPGTPPLVAELNKALVTRQDLPSGAWIDDTAGYDDLLVGGLQRCNPRAKGPGASVPAQGLAARSEEHVFMQTSSGASQQELLDQVVAFHPGTNAARAYMDSLRTAATGCPSFNDAMALATGSGASRLGDQVLELRTSNVSYQGYELLVRVKDTIIEVGEVSDTTVSPDHPLLTRVARLNVQRLAGSSAGK